MAGQSWKLFPLAGEQGIYGIFLSLMLLLLLLLLLLFPIPGIFEGI